MKNGMNNYVFEGLCEDLVRESLSFLEDDVTEEEIADVLVEFKELIDHSIALFGHDVEHTDYSTFLLEHIIGLYLILNRVRARGN